MPRSHPPTLLTWLRRSLREELPLRRGELMLVAVSGGGDSTALLHGLSIVAPRFGLRLAAHAVDHGLRPAAADEIEVVQELARSLAIPFTRDRVDVASGGNLQARARAARYASLERARQRANARWLATAHHARDRAETVLLRLLRGASLRGLGVLPVVSEPLVRPLVRAPKSAVDAHLRRHRLDHVEDPSNRDRRFLRTRVRHELMPLLEELSPGIVDHLTALADVCLESRDQRYDTDVFDDQGRLVELGRGQRTQLSKILASRRSGAAVLLSGGREIRLDHKTGLPHVISVKKGRRG